MRLRAATRGSTLARWQTDHVAALLKTIDPTIEVESVVVETTADRRIDIPIWEMGGKGVFVKEVQAAVLAGEADFAVHSAKDLPSTTAEGLTLAAMPHRADPRDCLVGCRFADLPTGGLVATGSVRRRAQLSWLRPDLRFTGLRGNIQTRLDRAGEFDAIVMAAAALDRLGLAGVEAERLDRWVMLPQVGQGAIAVECAGDDAGLVDLLSSIEYGPTRMAVDAERAFLAELAGVGGGCDLPAGAHATVRADGRSVVIDGVVASLDGRTVLRHRMVGRSPDIGVELARHLLDEGGAMMLLDNVFTGRPTG